MAAFKPDEEGHAASNTLLGEIGAGVHSVSNPVTVLVEFAAAIRRQVEDGGAVAPKAVERLRSVHTIRWRPVETESAIRAAIRAALRGMDAVVAAHAKDAGSVLVSLDKEILDRAPTVVRTVRPEAVLGRK